jgi:hypothetical protein
MGAYARRSIVNATGRYRFTIKRFNLCTIFRHESEMKGRSLYQLGVEPKHWNTVAPEASCLRRFHHYTHPQWRKRPRKECPARLQIPDTNGNVVDHVVHPFLRCARRGLVRSAGTRRGQTRACLGVLSNTGH